MVFGPTLRKFLPYINFVVATTALSFQYFVLYPWHKQLDEDFVVLKEDQHTKLEEYHTLKLQRLEEIEANITRLAKQQVKLELNNENLRK